MSPKKKQEFSSHPFKSLKGFSLQRQVEIKVHHSSAMDEERREYDFATEMNTLGVTVIPVDERLNSPQPPAHQSASILSPPTELSSEPVSDEELFLSALEGIQVVFQDEVPELEVSSLSPQRMRLVKQGRLRPADKLDLHGYTRAEARQRAAHFLENALHHRYSLVLIVTGWGKNSRDGEAVLRDEISRYLRTDGAQLVSDWAVAPPSLGGDGAFIVFLRRRNKCIDKE